QVSLTPLRFEGFSGISAILTDLSIRKQAEEAATVLASIVQATDDAIVSKSLDGTILSWNPGAERMYGYSEAQVLGQSFSMMLPEGAVDEWPVIVEKIKRGERVEHYETTRRRKDGQSLHVSLSSSPLRDAAGKVVGAAAIARDITERKRAEEALRRTSAYNRRLIEGSLDPLVTIGPDGKITDVNEATEGATGYPRAELIGKDFADYFTEPEEAREGYRRVFREGLVRDYALEIQNRDGHTIPVLYNAAIYRDEAGGVAGVIAAARDITERKRAAALLERHAAELARSNRELEQFAYIASHDLQEPLRMVASFLELLAERYKGRLDEKADLFISRAVDGAVRMKGLIDDLLGYSRVTTKARPLEVMETGAAVDEATSNLGKAIAEKGAVVTHDALPAVLADRTQLVQLFQNLIGNALKFCDGPPRVHVAAVRNAEEWVFSVRDNGIGIAPEHQERIFQIFQRLHGRDKYPGMGVGLAICQKVVERHGGRIWVESQPGEGSTFFFTLPVAGRRLS
ncbi:MAG: PAS domain S-box protein, partial [Isosphaeraceae bacterium]